MKRNSFTCLLLFTSFFTLFAAADPVVDDGKPVSSHITDVTVYADRAQVTRLAVVEPSTGSARFVFAGLPGWLDEGSVRVALVPPSAGEILDVQIRRTFLGKASDEEFSRKEAAVREISDQIAALDDEKAVLEEEAKQIDSIRAFSLDKLPRDVAVREIKPGEFGESVKFVTTSLREIAAAKRDLEKKRRDLQPELSARQRALDDLRRRSQLEERTVVVTLNGSAKSAELRLTYMLPGATWEPIHELRATPDGKTVALASHAVVRQTTGENWTGVNLWLSTQRSTETMKIPELESLLLGGGRRIARVAAASQSSFSAANRYFLDNITKWILELDKCRGLPFEGNYSSWLRQKAELLRVTEKKESSRQKTLARELEWINTSASARNVKNQARISAYHKLAAESDEDRQGDVMIQIPSGRPLGNKVLLFNNVSKRYSAGNTEVVALDRATLELRAGEFVGELFEGTAVGHAGPAHATPRLRLRRSRWT